MRLSPFEVWKSTHCPLDSRQRSKLFQIDFSLDDLRAHVSGEHVDYFPIGCGFCSSWFASEQQLQAHIAQRNHPEYKVRRLPRARVCIPVQAKELTDPIKEKKLASAMEIVKREMFTDRPPVFNPQPSVPPVSTDPIETVRAPSSGFLLTSPPTSSNPMPSTSQRNNLRIIALCNALLRRFIAVRGARDS